MSIPNSGTALLIMDMQTSILNRISEPATFIAGVVTAREHARTLGLPVFYVVVGFRPGLPEISENNKSFAAAKNAMATKNMNEWNQITPLLNPLPEEIIITKKRFSAFSGSDLEIILRAYNIRHLVLTGISTSGVVLSTTREAADKDFEITILSDGCSDADEEVQRVLMEKVFPRQATVMRIAEWMQV